LKSEFTAYRAVPVNRKIPPHWGVSPTNSITAELIRFGSNLRRERTARKMTQERLAELADLNIRTVQKIEAGEVNILITTAIRLQRALGCAWDKLFRAS
jgi:DNA-binding XRE family transcriptional regulator